MRFNNAWDILVNDMQIISQVRIKILRGYVGWYFNYNIW